MFCCNNPATLKRAAVFVFPAGTYCATNLGIKVIAYVMVQYQNNVILVAYTETLFLLCHIGIDIFLHWHEWELSNHLVFPWAQWTHCKSSVPVTLAGTLTLTRCFPKILAETQFSGQPIQSLSSGNQFGCWLNSVRLGRFKQNGFSGQHIQSLGAGNQFGAEATSWHLLCRGLSWKWIICKKLLKCVNRL